MERESIITKLEFNLGQHVDINSFNPNFNVEESGDEESSTVVQDKVERPKRYKVLMHNDDYTTMEFVVHILKTIFGKSMAQAVAIMMKIHLDGVGLCGVFTLEIAETKLNKVQQLARQNGHPLKCSLEPEE